MKKLLIAATFLLLAVPTAALADTPQETANRISKEIMSPFCPGLTVHDCPSDASVRLRNRIEAWAERGWSDKRIMDELVSEYGESIRAVPGSGTWVIWVVPAAMLAVGSLIAWFVARRWTREGTRAATEPLLDSPTANELGRLEGEISSFRERSWWRA